MTRPQKGASELIGEAESVVGSAFQHSFAPYLELVTRTTDIAVGLVDRVEMVSGDPRAIHVAMTLLARLVTDLNAVARLVRGGYAAQAMSLIAGMQELAHTALYVGVDEERATAWLEHSNTERSYPPISLKKMFKEVARAAGATEEAISREYDTIYQQACMVKHGNPIALGTVGVHSADDAVFIIAGPYDAYGPRRFTHGAWQFALRYTHLPMLAFVRDHVPEGAERDALYPILNELVSDYQRFTKESAEALGEEPVG